MDASESIIGGKSLLSLSIAAANANPIPTEGTLEVEPKWKSESCVQQNSNVTQWSASLPTAWTSGSLGSTKPPSQVHKHRRMSSLGHSRKRTSDAREATTRPSPAAVHTAASTLASLATFSSCPSKSSNPSGREGHPDLVNPEADSRLEGMGVSVSPPKDGKRGAIFRCETCSKVYRHPSCLVKHRWEHSPHWRETSKFLLSKHQQVQLLEAAAILSHLAPSARGGTSLPEDRALWPAYLSGGTLRPTTSIANPSMHDPVAEKQLLSLSSSLPNSPQQNRSLCPPLRVHDVGRGDPSDTISRTTSSPIDLRPAQNITSISSRSRSEGGHAWNPHSPSVISRSSYSPPTEDDSDFEIVDRPTLNRTFGSFEGRKEEAEGEAPGWDGMEMDMEM